MLKIARFDCAAIALISWAISAALTVFAQPLHAADASKPGTAASSSHHKSKPKLDRSGRKQVGKASVYAHKFANRKMADGNRMDPNDDNAASKTLPLGTRAKVTNLETGKSTEVTIQDRGPHVKGRIVDLPPAKAKEIGIMPRDGVAKVEVAPVELPLADGSIKAGEGAKKNAD